MTELVILRALPGAGKTTYARQWVAEDREHRARVNRDDIRQMLDEGEYVKGVTEGRVLAARDAMITGLLKRGINVINDDTNLPSRTVRDLIKLAVHAGADWAVTDMTDVPLETCLERNKARRDKEPVPEEILRDYHARFIHKKGFPLPVPEEVAYDGVVEPYVPDHSLPPAIIVDIDGTVALKGARDPFDETRVHEDRPNELVISLIRHLWGAYVYARDERLNVIFLSGRTEGCRQATGDWLDENVGVMYAGLYMREVGDYRKDWIVKQELFDKHVRGKYDVTWVFDDRDQVVRMWRDMGLQVFQVADGNF